MADRAKYPPGAAKRIERLLGEREQLERRHLRAFDPAVVALEAAIVRAIVSVGGERAPWGIREHARAMKAIRAAGVDFGQALTHRTQQAAHEATRWGAELQPRALSVLASASLGRRVPAPRVDCDAAVRAARETVDARTDAVGVAAGDELARVALSHSFLATRGAKLAAAGLVALSLAPVVAKKARDRAERVIATEMTAAAGEGGRVVQRGWARRTNKLRRTLDATLDRRVCATCAGLHHAVTDIDQPFPGGYDDAPIHPRCRCATMVWSESWTELLDELGIGPGPRTGVVGGVEIALPSFGSPAPAEFVASRS